MDHSPIMMPFSVGTDYFEVSETKQPQQDGYSPLMYSGLAIRS